MPPHPNRAEKALLNRYWDARAAQRDGSYKEDVETASRSNRPRGWDVVAVRQLEQGLVSGLLLVEGFFLKRAFKSPLAAAWTTPAFNFPVV